MLAVRSTGGTPHGPAGAEEELVKRHLPLVDYLVSEMASRVPRHVNRDDLVSAGMAGLAQAARSFEPERGTSFGRFASARIRGAILDELRARDWASRSVRSKARQVACTSDQLTARLGRRPTTTELAEAMGSTRKEVESINNDVHRAIVLNFDAPGAEGMEPATEHGPDDDVLEKEQKAYLVAAVDKLPARLRRVVIGYFFEELSMAELAGELGVTDSRISQMRAEALGLLRDAINSQLDPDLLGAERPGRPAKRRAAYFAAVAGYSDYRRRLSAEASQLASLLCRPARQAVELAIAPQTAPTRRLTALP